MGLQNLFVQLAAMIKPHKSWCLTFSWHHMGFTRYLCWCHHIVAPCHTVVQSTGLGSHLTSAILHLVWQRSLLAGYRWLSDCWQRYPASKAIGSHQLHIIPIVLTCYGCSDSERRVRMHAPSPWRTQWLQAWNSSASPQSLQHFPGAWSSTVSTTQWWKAVWTLLWCWPSIGPVLPAQTLSRHQWWCTPHAVRQICPSNRRSGYHLPPARHVTMGAMFCTTSTSVWQN